MSPIEREQLEADVVIVGAGPAGLACAIHLSGLIAEHNKQYQDSPLSNENIFVLEKADALGMHTLSGAVMDPRALEELVGDFETAGAPIDCKVADEGLYWLSEDRAVRAPLTPGFLRNHGNCIVSLGRLVRWLGERAEDAGVSVFTGVAATALLREDARVLGVRTDDKGVDRNGEPKSNFEPGHEVRAKVTVLAEGARGSLTKQLIADLGLDAGCNPQMYALGVKETWEIPPGRIPPGRVWHTVGYPLPTDMHGGGWVYAMEENRLSIGFVTALHYADPRFDPHEAMQRFKKHRLVRCLLEGGKLLQYGAKTLSSGGYWSIPRTAVDGALIIGEGAGFLDSRRLKGIHMAIKSGMLAAKTAYEALCADDTSESRLARFADKVELSWMKPDLWRGRNHYPALQQGLWRGIGHVLLQEMTGGRGIRTRYPARPAHEYLREQHQRRETSDSLETDGTITHDKLASVYHSGTRHEEDQPVHLKLADPDICHTRCTQEYGNPCQHFCPASVYEIIDLNGASRLKLNPANCLHCKTCDIMDPYQIITWVPTEGGGGPRYDEM